MLLHYIIKSKPLDMASLDTLDEQQLRTICRDCMVDNFSSLSKVSFSLTSEKNISLKYMYMIRILFVRKFDFKLFKVSTLFMTRLCW